VIIKDRLLNLKCQKRKGMRKEVGETSTRVTYASASDTFRPRSVHLNDLLFEAQERPSSIDLALHPSCELLESAAGFYTDIVPRDDISKRPTVAEILAHPSYPDTIWNLVPAQSGQLPVAAGRGGPFKIDWEVHGAGDIKLVVRELYTGFLQLPCDPSNGRCICYIT
jgi:hypothetical protein